MRAKTVPMICALLLCTLLGCAADIPEEAAGPGDRSPQQAQSSAPANSSEPQIQEPSEEPQAVPEESKEMPEETSRWDFSRTATNRTDDYTLRNLMLGKEPCVLALGPGEDQPLDLNGLPILQFDFEYGGESLHSVIPSILNNSHDLELVFEQDEQLYLRVYAVEEEAPERLISEYRFDGRFREWVDITYGKLFTVTVNNELLAELYPQAELNTFYPATTVYFVYEPIYDLKSMLPQDPYGQEIVTIDRIMPLYDVFDVDDYMLANVDHWRAINSFYHYTDAEGNIYTLYLSDGAMGLPFPEVFAGHIPEDWEIVYADDVQVFEQSTEGRPGRRS